MDVEVCCSGVLGPVPAQHDAECTYHKVAVDPPPVVIQVPGLLRAFPGEPMPVSQVVYQREDVQCFIFERPVLERRNNGSLFFHTANWSPLGLIEKLIQAPINRAFTARGVLVIVARFLRLPAAARTLLDH